MSLLSFFPSFTFLFNLFCFPSLCQRVVYWIFWTLNWIQSAHYFQRERERERETPQSSHQRGGRVVRWCWVNFQCRNVLLIWIIVWQRPIALAVGAGHFFSRLSFLFSFSLFGRRSDIDWNSLKRPLNPKQLSSQIHSWMVWEHQSIAATMFKVSDKNACRSIYRQ